MLPSGSIRMPLHGLMSTRDSTTSECFWTTPTPPPRFTRHRTERRIPDLASLNSTPDSSISITQTARGVEGFGRPLTGEENRGRSSFRPEWETAEPGAPADGADHCGPAWHLV